jgi:ribosomal protein S18 acetylase RimI-like enzyme
VQRVISQDAVSVGIRLLGPEDAEVLENVAPGVFDKPIDACWAAEFLSDARHHLVVALDGDLVVGMALGVQFIRPHKPPELWVNEMAVSSGHRGHGIARRLVDALLEHGRTLGCHKAWVATEPSNNAARLLYASVGGKEISERFVLIEFGLNGEG